MQHFENNVVRFEGHAKVHTLRVRVVGVLERLQLPGVLVGGVA